MSRDTGWQQRRNQTRKSDHEVQLRKVMFGFYKTDGFTPLSCPLEMAANRFHAHYDSIDAALRPNETTRAYGNTELCRYYSTCACATGIKVHISLGDASRTQCLQDIARETSSCTSTPRQKNPGLSLQHAFVGYVSKSRRHHEHKMRTGSYQAYI